MTPPLPGRPPGVGDAAYFTRWYADRPWSHYRPILSHVVRHGRPGPLLDLGAGTGLLVECATRFGFTATGLDASPDAVAIGRSRFPAIDLRHHDLDQPLPLDDDAFIAVVMNQVIEHLPPTVAERALGEAYRVLRPGGLLYVASPCRLNRAERDADPTHVHLYRPSELRALLTRLGFVGVTAMDAPYRGRLMKTLWQVTGGADRFCASATCRGYKPEASGG
ncbi:MAG: class I SAM-dependent methyltransferase [Planctomycetota bacterium]